MTKKQALKRWKAACERWIGLLGVSDYKREYQIYDEERTDNTSSAGIEAAEALVSTRYKWMKLDARRKYVEEASDDDLDETACHEVMHVLVDPLNDVAKELISALSKSRREGYDQLRSAQNERVTTHLAQVARRLHQNPRER